VGWYAKVEGHVGGKEKKGMEWEKKGREKSE
jgi:hypothetical protein